MNKTVLDSVLGVVVIVGVWVGLGVVSVVVQMWLPRIGAP